MLEAVQRWLVQLYDLRLDVSVRDFLCDASVARRLAPDALARGEALLVAADRDPVELGLYLDDRTLSQVDHRSAWRDEGRFRACLLLTEGVSHFCYLAYRAQHDQGASQFELELQGEVDKYAAAIVAARPRSPALYSRALRHRLFRRARFLDPPGTEAGARYRGAHRLAARYTARLERHLERRDFQGFRAELRRFYRKGAQGKVAQAKSSLLPAR